MTKIKICGIKRREDIEYINKYLPDYIGFVFANSKRRTSTEIARELSQSLDPRVKKVGVFVNSTIQEVLYCVNQCGLDVVQLHGDETPDYITELRSKMSGEKLDIWKAFKVKDENGIDETQEYRVDAFLLDTFVDGMDGGSGKTFNWNYVSKLSERQNIVLAGGLTSQNVIKAIMLVNPMMVDVSSGVETDFIKDEGKIKEFIETVRNF